MAITVVADPYLAVKNYTGIGFATESPAGRCLYDTSRWPLAVYIGSDRQAWLDAVRSHNLAVTKAIVATDRPIDLVPGEIAPHDAGAWTLQPGQATCGRTWRRATP